MGKMVAALGTSPYKEQEQTGKSAGISGKYIILQSNRLGLHPFDILIQNNCAKQLQNPGIRTSRRRCCGVCPLGARRRFERSETKAKIKKTVEKNQFGTAVMCSGQVCHFKVNSSSAGK